MKRFIIILSMLIGLLGVLSAQSKRNAYAAVNLPPLWGRALEMGFEVNLTPRIALDIYTGYVFNSKLNSPFKKGTQYDLNNKSGFFLKIGTRCNFRNSLSNWAPFVGLNIVNALAIEEGFYYADFYNITPSVPVNKNSCNFGINGIVGLSTSSDKRFNIDIGIQAGKVIVENMLDFHSYMPGMGNNFGSKFRIQGILRIKYRLYNGY